LILLAESDAQTPGPGQYGLPCTDMYKTRAPGYTMIGRRTQSTGNVNTPGPAAHSPDLVDLAYLFTFSRLLLS